MRPFLSRILLVGEAPNRRGANRGLDVALACRAAGFKRGAGVLHLLDEDFPRLYDFCMATQHVNLLREWPGPSGGKGSAFPAEEAREAADRMAAALRGGRVPWEPTGLPTDYRAVLLAGTRVRQAFHLGGNLFERDDGDPALPPVYVVPHPSGVNPFWNSRENRNRARAFLEGIVREVDAEDLCR